jgi:hypothetical protein
LTSTAVASYSIRQPILPSWAGGASGRTDPAAGAPTGAHDYRAGVLFVEVGLR